MDEIPLWADQRIANAFSRRFRRPPTAAERQSLQALYRRSLTNRRPMTALKHILEMIDELTAGQLTVEGHSAMERLEHPRPQRLPLDRALEFDGYLLTSTIAGGGAVFLRVRRHGHRLYVSPSSAHPNGRWVTARDERILLNADAISFGLEPGTRALTVPFSHPALEQLREWGSLPDHGPVDGSDVE